MKQLSFQFINESDEIKSVSDLINFPLLIKRLKAEFLFVLGETEWTQYANDSWKDVILAAKEFSRGRSVKSLAAHLEDMGWAIDQNMEYYFDEFEVNCLFKGFIESL